MQSASKVLLYGLRENSIEKTRSGQIYMSINNEKRDALSRYRTSEDLKCARC
jgi:hypothetical protein